MSCKFRGVDTNLSIVNVLLALKCLVGGLEPWNFMTFPYIGKFITPTDEVIFFRGLGEKPPTRCCTKTHTVLQRIAWTSPDLIPDGATAESQAAGKAATEVKLGGKRLEDVRAGE